MDGNKNCFGWLRRLRAGFTNPQFAAAVIEILLLWLGAIMAVALLILFSGGQANRQEQPAPHPGKNIHNPMRAGADHHSHISRQAAAPPATM